MSPLLSIAVATRNRQRCAHSLIAGLHASSAQDFELVFHDNSDDTSLGDVIAALGDPRVRYLHSHDRLNMHQNFDRAIDASRGQYVCLLGDDDGILVEPTLAILEIARARGIDAVLPGIYGFNWPGVHHWHWGDIGGRLLADGGGWPKTDRLHDPAHELAQVMASGVTCGLQLLPRVYQGIVSRRCLDMVKARTGTLFPGPSPDMANAVALATVVRSIWQHPDLVLISGHSANSGGGAGTAGRHHGRLEDQPHLPAGTVEEWTPAIPRFWSGLTIYAQSALVAARRMGAPPPPITIERLYAACLVFERRPYWHDVRTAMRAHPDYGPVMLARVAKHVAVLFASRSWGFVGSFLHYRVGKGDQRRFGDIAELMAFLTARNGKVADVARAAVEAG